MRARPWRGGRRVHLVGTVRERVTAHLLELGPAYATGEQSGEVASALVDGTEAIEAWVRSFRPAALLAGIVPVLVLVVVAIIDPPSALVLLVTGPVLVLLLGLIGSRVGPATAARAADLRWMQGYFADMLRGLATLRAYGRSREQVDRIREIGLRYGDATMRVLRTAFQASLVLEWGAAVAIAFIAVELSLRLMTGGIAFLPTLAVLILAPEFFMPLRRFASTYHEGAAGREAAARIMAILDAPVPAAGRALCRAVERAIPGSGDIVLEGVTVAYPGRPEPALASVDLVLAAGTAHGDRRRVGCGQVDRSPGCCSGSSIPTRDGSPSAGGTSRRSTRRRGGRASPTSRSRRTCSTARSPTTSGSPDPTRPTTRSRPRHATPTPPPFIEDLPDGYATRDRRGRRPPERRPAPADRHRAGVPPRRRPRRPRRADRAPRPRRGGRGRRRRSTGWAEAGRSS